MGPFEKIVDQIRGVFNFGGSFGVPRLGPDPRPKIRGAVPAYMYICRVPKNVDFDAATRRNNFVSPMHCTLAALSNYIHKQKQIGQSCVRLNIPYV